MRTSLRNLAILLVVLTVAAPLAASAQQRPLPVISFLQCFGVRPAEGFVSEEFRKGLSELGYAEGMNVAIEGNWAEGDYNRLPSLAAELVRRKVSVIVAWGLPCVAAAKAATATIPIVFWAGADPVAQGLVASLARPGGNLTGLTDLASSLGAKRVELLRELLPKATEFAFLMNPANPNAEPQTKDVQQAAQAAGVQLHIMGARTESEIEATFASLSEKRTEALIVAADPFLFSRRELLVALAARYGVPTMYTVPAYAALGGLISYTSQANDKEMRFQVGRYIGRVLNGEKPADLPIIVSARFQLVINLKTAKTLGIPVPQSLLARADEVIE